MCGLVDAGYAFNEDAEPAGVKCFEARFPRRVGM